AFAWAGFVISLLNRKHFTIQLGLFAALVTLIAGLPLGFVTSIEEVKFSMFFLAPILSLILKITLVSPKGNKIIADWINY
ncbi:MAG: hypothetical protein GPJ54_07615, partial [Candidatus Heimdallarchaeota archaeon]|nr:hypothetical protein [Candidatus Heimdallarchaeota archaeon]